MCQEVMGVGEVGDLGLFGKFYARWLPSLLFFYPHKCAIHLSSE